jgi:lysophospholipase L1-like esterase
LNGLFVAAQTTAWDDTVNKNWPPDFRKVNIESSFDHSLQSCIIYKTTCSKPQPLIVSLHTWSGDYMQQDSLCYQVTEKDWNYIHPDFRGPNNQPLAMGSPAVVKDIDDAIRFAIKNMNVDTTEVHIVGVSGGGYATMLCYMKLKYPAKSFSSWAGISDLKAWYEESIGRKQKYAEDILKSTSGTSQLDTAEAVRRSPLYMPVSKNRGKLFLYEGIHDGYLGSVPITQTINFYNHVVHELHPDSARLLVSNQEILDMVVKRCLPGAGTNRTIAGRKVWYFKNTEDVSLCIFEGKHERLEPVALSLLPVYKRQPNRKLNILTLGDSNGFLKNGWPRQLVDEVPYSNIINISKVGKTIGFDNNGDTTLNQLKTLHYDLGNASQQTGSVKFDYIVIELGTNDAKAVFDKRQKEVVSNLELLINQIKNSKCSPVNSARIVILSPPPYGKEAELQQKYSGGLKRVTKMNHSFKNVAQKQGCIFIDAFTPLQPYIDILAKDGIHLNSSGQKKIAALIAQKF